MNKPPHKHTHLQAAQSQRTDQSLQKSVLLANAQPTDTKSDREKGAAANNQSFVGLEEPTIKLLLNPSASSGQARFGSFVRF